MLRSPALRAHVTHRLTPHKQRHASSAPGPDSAALRPPPLHYAYRSADSAPLHYIPAIANSRDRPRTSGRTHPSRLRHLPPILRPQPTRARRPAKDTGRPDSRRKAKLAGHSAGGLRGTAGFGGPVTPTPTSHPAARHRTESPGKRLRAGALCRDWFRHNRAGCAAVIGMQDASGPVPNAYCVCGRSA